MAKRRKAPSREVPGRGASEAKLREAFAEWTRMKEKQAMELMARRDAARAAADKILAPLRELLTKDPRAQKAEREFLALAKRELKSMRPASSRPANFPGAPLLGGETDSVTFGPGHHNRYWSANHGVYKGPSQVVASADRASGDLYVDTKILSDDSAHAYASVTALYVAEAGGSVNVSTNVGWGGDYGGSTWVSTAHVNATISLEGYSPNVTLPSVPNNVYSWGFPMFDPPWFQSYSGYTWTPQLVFQATQGFPYFLTVRIDVSADAGWSSHVYADLTAKVNSISIG